LCHRCVSRKRAEPFGHAKGSAGNVAIWRKTGDYQMAGIEKLTALRESLAELRRKEAYVLCDNPSAGIDRLVQIHLAIQAIDAVIEGEAAPKLDPDAVVP
jgi:hypothetical protein